MEDHPTSILGAPRRQLARLPALGGAVPHGRARGIDPLPDTDHHGGKRFPGRQGSFFFGGARMSQDTHTLFRRGGRRRSLRNAESIAAQPKRAGLARSAVFLTVPHSSPFCGLGWLSPQLAWSPTQAHKTGLN